MMMKPMNEMSLSFLSYSANEGFARATVAAFVAQPTILILLVLEKIFQKI